MEDDRLDFEDIGLTKADEQETLSYESLKTLNKHFAEEVTRVKTQLDLLVRTPTESKVKDFLKPKMLLQFIKVVFEVCLPQKGLTYSRILCRFYRLIETGEALSSPRVGFKGLK